MKTKTIALTLLFLTVLFIQSCQTGEDDILTQQDLSANFIQNVKEMNLQEQFNFSNDTYGEFISSLVFTENGNLRGTYIGGIHEELNENQKKVFWKNFNIHYEDGFNTDDEKARV